MESIKLPIVVPNYEGGDFLESTLKNVTLTIQSEVSIEDEEIKLPYAMSGVEAELRNGVLRILGGRNSSSVLKTTIVFDKSTKTTTIDETTRLIPSPKTHFAFGKCTHNTMIVGGFNASASYDSDLITINNFTDVVKSTTNSLFQRAYAAYFVLNDTLYVFGGRNTNSFFKNGFKIVDGETTPTTLEDMPLELYGASGFAYDGNGYVAGGFTSSGTPNKTIYKYDVSLNTWSIVGYLKRDKGFMGVYVSDSSKSVYFFGGALSSNSSTQTDEIECFDLSTNKTSVLDITLNSAKESVKVALYGSVLYILGGYNATDGYSSGIQRFIDFSVIPMEVYYTTNGTDPLVNGEPSTSAILYTEAFTLNIPCELKTQVKKA